MQKKKSGRVVLIYGLLALSCHAGTSGTIGAPAQPASEVAPGAATTQAGAPYIARFVTRDAGEAPGDPPVPQTQVWLVLTGPDGAEQREDLGVLEGVCTPEPTGISCVDFGATNRLTVESQPDGLRVLCESIDGGEVVRDECARIALPPGAQVSFE